MRAASMTLRRPAILIRYSSMGGTEPIGGPARWTMLSTLWRLQTSITAWGLATSSASIARRPPLILSEKWFHALCPEAVPQALFPIGEDLANRVRADEAEASSNQDRQFP